MFNVMSKNNPSRLPRVSWPENIVVLIGAGYNSGKN